MANGSPTGHLQMLEFNVPGGKLNRGMAVLDVLKALQGTEVVLHSPTLQNCLLCSRHPVGRCLAELCTKDNPTRSYLLQNDICQWYAECW